VPVATADTSKLIATAMHALSCIWKPGYRYKKAGVTFPELGPAASVQGDLW
jgi:DNA polymerase V